MPWLEFSADEPYSVRVYQTCFSAVLYGCGALLMACYWYRRKHPVLASRSPEFAVVFGLCLLVNATLDIPFVLTWRPNLFCTLDAWAALWYAVSGVSLMGIFASTVWRLCVLIERFEVQRIRLAIALHDDGYLNAPFEANCTQRHIGWLTSRPVRVALCVYALLAPVVALGAGFHHDAHLVGSDGHERCKIPDDVQTYSYIVGGLTCIVLAVKLRAVQDGFAIVSEFKRMGVCALCYLVVDQTTSRTSSHWTGSPSYTLYLSLCVHAPCYLFVFALPLYRSWRAPARRVLHQQYTHKQLLLPHKAGGRETSTYRPSHAPSQYSTPVQWLGGGGGGGGTGGGSGADATALAQELKSFDEVLRSVPGRRSFEKHLMLEFAIESLLFLDDVELLRATPADVPSPDAVAQQQQQQQHQQQHGRGGGQPPPPLPPLPLTHVSVECARERAQVLYHKYVAQGAPFELNLSHTVAKTLHAVFGPAGVSAGPTVAAGAGGGGGGGGPTASQFGSSGPTASVASSGPPTGPTPSAAGSVVGGGGGPTLSATYSTNGHPTTMAMAAAPIPVVPTGPAPAPAQAGGPRASTRRATLGSSGASNSNSGNTNATAGGGGGGGVGALLALSSFSLAAAVKHLPVNAPVPSPPVGSVPAPVVVPEPGTGSGAAPARLAAVVESPLAAGAVAASTVSAVADRPPAARQAFMTQTPAVAPAPAPAPTSSPATRPAASTAAVVAASPSPARGITITVRPYPRADPSAVPPDARDAAFYLSIFDAAHSEVYTLLLSDSFPRYVASPLYDELLRNMALSNAIAADAGVIVDVDDRRVDAASDSAADSGGAAGAASRAGGARASMAVNPKHAAIALAQMNAHRSEQQQLLQQPAVRSTAAAAGAGGATTPSSGLRALTAPTVITTPSLCMTTAATTVVVTAGGGRHGGGSATGPNSGTLSVGGSSGASGGQASPQPSPTPAALVALPSLLPPNAVTP